MGWATAYIEKLKRGETVQFRPRGNSMAGKIESEQLCTVVPVRAGHLNVGDIVLCKVNGFQYFHLIKAIRAIDSRFTFAPSYGLSGQKQSWQKNDDGNKAAEFERLFSSVRFYCCSSRFPMDRGRLIGSQYQLTSLRLPFAVTAGIIFLFVFYMVGTQAPDNDLLQVRECQIRRRRQSVLVRWSFRAMEGMKYSASERHKASTHAMT